MSDEHRKLAAKIVRTGGDPQLLVAFERKVRLEEAKWWADYIHKVGIGLSIEQEKRIAALTEKDKP